MDVPSCSIVGHEYEPADNCRACAAERLADTDADRAPMRPAEAPEAVRAVAERHRVRSSRREFGQPFEMRPVLEVTEVPRCDRCGGAYLDDPESLAAHLTVFGHMPPERPAAAQSAPNTPAPRPEAHPGPS
jgi:hypothetical protein